MGAADAAYQRGDCASAMRLYADALRDPAFSGEHRQSALFKSGYCNLNASRFEEAKTALQQHLKGNPANTDARLLYVQALQGLHRYEASLLVIHQTRNPGKLEPDFLYWKGAARYALDEFGQARSAFEECVKVSPKGYWTLETCQKALVDLDSQKGDPFFYVRGGLGFVYDGNVSSSTSQYTTFSAPKAGKSSVGQRPGSQTTVDTANIIRDRAYVAKAGLDLNWVRGRKVRLTTPLDFSLTQYSQQKAYSLASGSAALKATYYATERWAPAASLSYTDYRYNWVPSSKTVAISPSATYYASTGSSYYVAVDFTRTFFGTRSTSLGGHATASWYSDTNGGYLDVLASRNLGEKAVITNQPGQAASVTSGSLASRYWSVGATASYRWEVYWRISVAPSFSATLSLYDPENLPPPPPPPSGQQAAPAPVAPPNRKDLLLVPAVTVSRPLVIDAVTVSLTLQFSKNQSSGFQGLPDSSGQLASQSYTRPYAQLELAFWF